MPSLYMDINTHISSMPSFSESDTRSKLIDPKLKDSQWDESYIIREQAFTDGRILPGGKRGKILIPDYRLRYKNCTLAIIEAKSNAKEPTEGLQQAIEYAEKLKVQFAYSSNGEKIYEHDLSTGKGDYIDVFPTPEELYARSFPEENKMRDDLFSVSYDLDSGFPPRYYQDIAIQRTMEAIAQGQTRILLNLATGAGKTPIAFQIAHKLFKASWSQDPETVRRPKILFLADRNVLVEQAMNKFNSLESECVQINGKEIKDRSGKVPTNANIFFAIYQAIADRKKGDDLSEEDMGFYKQYPQDFFDIIIIDECHRGSANGEGSWRAILDHFETAIHVGMTATPKRKDNVDTYDYFGAPVYEYSLKDGINDGFLTPYKIKRIKTNIDEYIHTSSDIVVKGEIQKDMYEMSDFERTIVIPERTELIAKSILQNIKPLEKTIIFCADQNHALMMRDFINKYKTNTDSNYCVRVTSNEGEIGREMLERFQDNDKDIPAILTSSQMLTTGVDARNVRNVVLVRTIASMVEFKQIVGRGTRVYDGKDSFTIIDYTGATNLFYDDEWDGIPIEKEETVMALDVEIDDKSESYEITEDNKTKEDYERDGEVEDIEPEGKIVKTEVKLSNGRKLKVIDIETRYIGEDGRPLSSEEFLEKLVGELPSLYENEEQLRKIWSNPDNRELFLSELAEKGFDKDQLQSMQELFDAEDSDIFDVLSHISFSNDIVKRSVRADFVRNEIGMFEHLENLKAKDFIEFLLERYEQDGISELKRDHLVELIKLNDLGTPQDAFEAFGGKDNLIDSYYKVQEELYTKI